MIKYYFQMQTKVLANIVVKRFSETALRVQQVAILTGGGEYSAACLMQELRKYIISAKSHKNLNKDGDMG